MPYKHYSILSKFYSTHLNSKLKTLDKVQRHFETNIVNIKISFLFSLFMQQQTHSSVKISRPFLMKRLENVVGGASCEAQRIPSSSSAGNLLLRIIRGWVLLVKHMANVVFYFQSHIDTFQFKDIYISIRTDQFVRMCSFLSTCNPNGGKDSRRAGGLGREFSDVKGISRDWHSC